MLLLTAKLSQFNYDKDLVEQQWEIVQKELEKLLAKYKELIFKYRNDQEIGLKVQALEVKLNALNDTFDAAFDPNDYINSATRMYLVN